MTKSNSAFQSWKDFFKKCSLDLEINAVLSSLVKSPKDIQRVWKEFAASDTFIDVSSETFAPSKDRVLEAFRRVPPADIKIVIVSYEPYRSGNATGLAFQVPEHHRVTGSLRNIFKELDLEYYSDRQTSKADLDKWSRQGVLLLNAALTAPLKAPEKNHGKLWTKFTNNFLYNLSREHPEKVYMLWGTFAKSFKSVIDPVNNLILTTGHPGDRNVNRHSAIWFGHNHFVRANEFLPMVSKTPIDWFKGRQQGGPLKHDLQFSPRSKHPARSRRLSRRSPKSQ